MFMAKYPYILKTGSLKKYFENIPIIGTPEKVSQKYLSSLGFTSSNERSIPNVLKFLGFIDDSGTPSDVYILYRDRSKSKKILGEAIVRSYSDLFKLYPDAHKKDYSALQNYFSTNTGLGLRAVQGIVETFKALCSLADIEAGEVSATEDRNEEKLSQDSNNVVEQSSYHNLSFGLKNGKIAKVIIPQDIEKEDVERLKKLLDALC